MEYKDTLNKIKHLLGMQVKLAQMTLVDGFTVIESENFAAGEGVFIVQGEDRIALPEGEYELESGQILVVMEEGVVGEIKEAMQPEPEEEMGKDKEVEMEKEAAPKKVVESTVKESHFSAEDVKALVEKIEVLEAEIVSLKEAKKEELSETKRIAHNPEAKSKMNFAKSFSANGNDTIKGRVMSKIANIKK